MSYDETLTTDAAFARYEEIRSRMPAAQFPDQTEDCAGLVELADRIDAYVLDSFGVLNVGDAPIPGAADCIAALRGMGKRLIVLTNAASYTRANAIEKYKRLGFDFTEDEVVSSRDVALAQLDNVLPNARWGAIAAPEDRFEDIMANVHHWSGGPCDGFLLLSSAALSAEVINALEAALRRAPRPVVVANPDLVAPRETGLSKEPGFYAHLLADRLQIAPVFFGKPFGNAFDVACSRLGNIPADRIAMVGDTLHTDILGGRAAGLRTVLVRDHGLFVGRDTAPFIQKSGIVPCFACGSI